MCCPRMDKRSQGERNMNDRWEEQTSRHEIEANKTKLTNKWWCQTQSKWMFDRFFQWVRNRNQEDLFWVFFGQNSHLTDEVEERFALWANQAGQELWDPCQPLDGRHSNAVLVHGICKSVLVIKAEQPQHLKENMENVRREGRSWSQEKRQVGQKEEFKCNSIMPR